MLRLNFKRQILVSLNGAANEPEIHEIFRNRLLWTAGKSEKGAVLFLRHGPLIDRK
jgi:hypothetical protein